MDPKEKALREVINAYPGETTPASFLVVTMAQKLGTTATNHNQAIEEIRHYLASLLDAGNLKSTKDGIVLQWLTPAEEGPTTKRLEDDREEALLQVVLLAGSVIHDTDNPRNDEATHYIVDKDTLDALRRAVEDFDRANEALIIRMSQVIQGAFQTPEM